MLKDHDEPFLPLGRALRLPKANEALKRGHELLSFDFLAIALDSGRNHAQTDNYSIDSAFDYCVDAQLR